MSYGGQWLALESAGVEVGADCEITAARGVAHGGWDTQVRGGDRKILGSHRFEMMSNAVPQEIRPH